MAVGGVLSSGEGDGVLVAVLIGSPSVGAGPPFAAAVGVAWLYLTKFQQYLWFSVTSAGGASRECQA